ncbi:hypothetical protein [Pseudomonas sp. CCC4.4]|uniref:hypothetical protein n=1 Tax=Pseudomonas sp. CCC4.4 TaxID=3048612 RepID=UPI002B229515|nr:hypothetical protein [Pseudomonas sp. CCC4.4]MEB0170054.1 hypothetical protein [Pseudomonas sp. CCC4.4]
MTDIKYTDDGKKVIVVGKLNAQQTIVQEIFVSAGQEIPSGENFVVKSLHDQPAESWKEKNLRELELRYEKSRKTLEADIAQQASRLTMIKEKAKLHADALFKFVTNSNEGQLGLLKKVMSGQITHVFVSGYSPEIFEWDGGKKTYDIDNYHGRAEIKGIKLLSLFGYSDGDLEYRLHTYRDGSGGSEQVFPAASYKEALALAQAECDLQSAAYLAKSRANFSMADWKKIEGVIIPEMVAEKYEEALDADRLKRIESLLKEVATLQSKAPRKE